MVHIRVTGVRDFSDVLCVENTPTVVGTIEHVQSTKTCVISAVFAV